MIQQNFTLFKDPQVKYPIADLNLPFSDYLLQCRRLISNTRVDLPYHANPELVIDANAPFEWQPARKAPHGVLLLHGLYDCPFVMRDIGRQLQAQGLLVRSLLLPGHGTVPGGLLNVSYLDWVQTLRYGLAQLAPQVNKIFLVGFSTGASLALNHLLQKDAYPIAGAVLVAPAIQIAAGARFTNWLPSLGFQWLRRAAEIDYTKYCSFTFNSAYQIYQLTQKIHRASRDRKITCPLLFCISEDDKTTLSEGTLAFFARCASQNSRLILYSDHATTLKDPRIIQRPASYPEWHIQDISHISLPIAPDNPHYGKNGDYPLASYVEANKLQSQPIIYGTTSDFSRTGPTPQKMRLTFNPDFDFFAGQLREFISSF